MHEKDETPRTNNWQGTPRRNVRKIVLKDRARQGNQNEAPQRATRRFETKKTKLQQKANQCGKALFRREPQGESRSMEQATKGEPSRESLIPESIQGRMEPWGAPCDGLGGTLGAIGDALGEPRGHLGGSLWAPRGAMATTTKGEPARESLIQERIPGRTPVNGTSNKRRAIARKPYPGKHPGENGALGGAL